MKYVETIMTRDPVCCLPTDAVMLAARAMKNNSVGAIPVVEDRNSRKLIGIITDRDIATRVTSEGMDAKKTMVGDVMTKEPVHCHPSDTLAACEELMSKYQVRRVPVVDATKRCNGIVAQADVVRHAGAESVKHLLGAISASTQKTTLVA